jgi:hypothetical protein
LNDFCSFAPAAQTNNPLAKNRTLRRIQRPT